MGHRFEFEVIPLAEAVSQPHEVPDEPETRTVLVVDDEPLIVDSLAAILSGNGLNVMKAYNGSSALELAMQAPPDLLLTDVAMPGMNGLQLAMAVADSIPSCRVLLFSAHASTLDLYPSKAAGFDFQLLAKPVHPREMLRQVFASLESRTAKRRIKAQTMYTAQPHSAPWRLVELNP